MKILRREGPFVVEITGDLLSARRHQAGEGWGTAGTGKYVISDGMVPVFILPRRNMPWFVMHGDGLYAQNAHDALSPLYRGDDAAQLLTGLIRALTSAENRRSACRNIGIGMGIAAIALGILIWSAFTPLTEPHGIGLSAKPLFSTTTNNGDAGRPVPPPPPSHPKAVLAPPVPIPAAENVPTDGWNLPSSVRAGLPEKLRNAASRGIFTVPLSSGHARTLYVFADPACPNCQRMERHFETVSGMVNVVIFPVTIEGRESSLKALTPVMALPEAERAAAWKRLFAADAGISVPVGSQAAPVLTDEAQAETARGAIGVNEVAFRAYQLPGTPWTISDDGRYVPQAVMSSESSLATFLGGTHD